MKLLGLKKGEHTIEGCAIAFPKKATSYNKELNLEESVTYMK